MFGRCILIFATSVVLASGASWRPFTIDQVMADLKSTHPQAMRVSDSPVPGIVAHEGLTYSQPAGVALQLDLCRPAGTERLPAVILVHGDGWLFR